MTHREWFDSLPGHPSISAAAREAGIQKTTLMRQIDRGEIPSDNVIRLARAFDINIPDALVATGYATEEEMARAGLTAAAGYLTNREILEEMMKRVDPEARRLFHGEEGEITPNFEVVSDQALHVDSPVRPRNTPNVSPLAEDVPHAASTAPLEPEEGDDDYHGGA